MSSFVFKFQQPEHAVEAVSALRQQGVPSQQIYLSVGDSRTPNAMVDELGDVRLKNQIVEMLGGQLGTRLASSLADLGWNIATERFSRPRPSFARGELLLMFNDDAPRDDVVAMMSALGGTVIITPP